MIVRCLKDEDPYVRKTAAVCVAKLYDINGELVEDQGFLDMVYDLLGDSNPMVVSNAVASLAEIAETSELGQKVRRMLAHSHTALSVFRPGRPPTCPTAKPTPTCLPAHPSEPGADRPRAARAPLVSAENERTET